MEGPIRWAQMAAPGIVISVASTLKPKSHTATTATYTLKAGAIKATVKGITVSSSAAATMVVTVASGGDSIAISGTFSVLGQSLPISGTISLPAGSFKAAALKHPTKFTPASISVSS